MQVIYKKSILFLLILMILSPIGILLPKLLNAGSAWGEWTSKEVTEQVGFTPKKMDHTFTLKGILPDYSLGNENSTLLETTAIYSLSALIGLLIIALPTAIIYFKFRRHE